METTVKLNIPILGSLNFPNRALKCFQRLGILNLNQLLEFSKNDLMKMRNLGIGTVEKIESELRRIGLRLKDGDVLKEKINYRTINKINRDEYAMLLIPIEYLLLSQRSENVIKQLKLKYIGDLISKDENTLLKLKNFGKKSLSEIKAKLRLINLSLNTVIDEWPPDKLEDSITDFKLEINRVINSKIIEILAVNNSKIYSLEQESEYYLSKFAKNKRDWEFVAKFYGLDGSGKKTLETVGQYYGVTRERVRQVVERYEEKLKKANFIHKNNFKYINLANKNIQNNLPDFADNIENNLLNNNVTSSKFNIEGIISINSLINLKTKFKIINFQENRFVVGHKEAKIPDSIYQCARRCIENRGVSTIAEIADLISKKESTTISEEYVEKFLLCVRDFSWLDKKSGWFWFKEKPPRSRLRNLILKVLAVSSEIDISDLRSGVSRYHRLEGFSPPKHVLLELCKQIPWCCVKGLKISCNHNKNWEDIFEKSSTEWAIVTILKEYGPIMNRVELQKKCYEVGMSNPAFYSALRYSPVITKYDIGVYGLRGSRSQPHDIATIKGKKKAEKVIEDYGWTKDYKIWISYKISTNMLESGIFSIPSSLNEQLFGDFKLFTADENFICDIKIGSYSGWSLSRLYKKRGGDSGDYLILTFDVINRNIVAYLGDIELLEEFKSEE